MSIIRSTYRSRAHAHAHTLHLSVRARVHALARGRVQLAKSVASAYDGAHMHIGDRTIGTTEPCFIIAEAGVNHNGSVDLALQLVRRRDPATCNSACMRYATSMWRTGGCTSCGVVFKR